MVPIYASSVEVATDLIYLNSAQCGLVMVPVARAIEDFLAQRKSHGCMGWEDWLERREAARATVAGLIGAPPSHVSFVGSTSHGLSTMAYLLRRAGKTRVLTTDEEFVSTLLPWRHYGFEIERIGTPEKLRDHAGLRARLEKVDILATAHVYSYSGLRNDLRSLGTICRETETLFVVNATQSAGIFDIDVAEDCIDMLTFTGFKWLMAGYGTGVLYVNRDRIDASAGPLVGWMSLEDPYADELRAAKLATDGRSLECGVPDFSRAFALDAAINELRRLGLEWVRQRILTLCDRIRAEARARQIEILGPASPEMQSGIVCVKIADATAVEERLRQRGIAVSAKPNLLRVSPHFFNTEEDIAALFSALDQLR